MKGHYAIDVDRRMIYKTHLGTISVDDEIELMNAVISDPKYQKGMNSICDFSKASVNWSFEDLDRFRAHVSQIAHLVGKCKWAVVFPPGSDTSTAKAFITLHSAFNKDITVRLFDSGDSAIEWIGQSEAIDSESRLQEVELPTRNES
jgi:hypothetical protein